MNEDVEKVKNDGIWGTCVRRIEESESGLTDQRDDDLETSVAMETTFSSPR